MYENNLHIETGGHVYVEIRRGIYGLKEDGIIIFIQIVVHHWPLESHLMKYYLCDNHQQLQRQLFSKDENLHLINEVRNHFKVNIYWEGKVQCRMKLN